MVLWSGAAVAKARTRYLPAWATIGTSSGSAQVDPHELGAIHRFITKQRVEIQMFTQ
jgi:hypothetical protein